MADQNKILLSKLLLNAISKRRTWASLFFIVYALLLSFSWNFIISIRSWYDSSSSSSNSSAIYASILYGSVFGILSMGAALAVAIPATLVTWITILVLLAFAGKTRRMLVIEGRRITADIARFAVKIVVREGNLVAGFCAFVSFVALILRNRGGREKGDLGFDFD